MRFNITVDHYSEDNTICICLMDNNNFDLFWIDNSANPQQIIEDAKRIEISVNIMTDEFIDNVSMIRSGGNERLDIAYELCDYLARNQKLLDSLIFNS